ncbi:streptophobe family protein [Streptomyces sp. NPDC058291]|uniref:streptophobe family protein n=1 Tax=Streptomyces sp. NPDC058291 TaxID=3346427 RepID=UPI0036F161CF
MRAGTSAEGGGSTMRAGGVPWTDVLLAAVAAVSWALIGMAGTAALGLHLLKADAAGSLGTMTAAVVALGAGGSVTPSGDVSAFGLSGAQADTAVEITPLGVSLVGALLLSWFFLRSLRTAGAVIAPAELVARAGAVVALFVAMLGGLAWAGHDVITLDGSALGLDGLPGTGGGGGGGGLDIPGLGDVGDVGGLLPDRLGDLVHAKAAVGFTVDTAPTLLGGLGWSLGILLIALLASRRSPLPHGWQAVHRVVRPAASAVVTVALIAVAAGFAAAAYAAIGDDHPRRIAGAALLGAPNGVWLGIPIGLFVPWDGQAKGALTTVLPAPLDGLLGVGTRQPVTLGRLAELDGRVWLLAVAAALIMLLAGVLTAVRTPWGASMPRTGPVAGAAGSGPRGAVGSRGAGADVPASGAGGPGGGARGGGAGGFVGWCAVRLGSATALALPSAAWSTDVSVNASLSVLGFDAFGAGIELHGRLGTALLLGALWGAGAGAVGASLACATGAAGRLAAPAARGDAGRGGGAAVRLPAPSGYADDLAGPYAPGGPSYRPPNPATNPYLRVPDHLRGPAGDAGPGAGPKPRSGTGPGPGAKPGAGAGHGGTTDRPRSHEGSGREEPPPPGPDDVYGAPTVARPIGPPPRAPRERPSSGPDDGPPPPPPPPPRGPRTPRGPR